MLSQLWRADTRSVRVLLLERRAEGSSCALSDAHWQQGHWVQKEELKQSTSTGLTWEKLNAFDEIQLYLYGEEASHSFQKGCVSKPVPNSYTFVTTLNNNNAKNKSLWRCKTWQWRCFQALKDQSFHSKALKEHQTELNIFVLFVQNWIRFVEKKNGAMEKLLQPDVASEIV